MSDYDSRRWRQKIAKRLNKINRVQKETNPVERRERREAPPGGWRTEGVTLCLHWNTVTFYIELICGGETI